MISMVRLSLLIAASVLLGSFGTESDFRRSKSKRVPDYSAETNWIALPWRHDVADTVPAGCPTPDNQVNAVADVFYVHPTMLLTGNDLNGDLDDQKLNKRCDECTRHQASPFNACARVFAPRYRQGHLKCFKPNNAAGKIALDTAYADVKKAFEYYLAHWNQGRPIILAGHSQGAFHLERLIKEFCVGKPLLKQLVAAYPIGFNIKANAFAGIPLGDSASQTGCFVTWNTVKWGQDTTGNFTFYRGSACVNPLTWKSETNVVNGSLQKGAVPLDFKSVKHSNISQVRIYGTLLWIDFNEHGSKHFFHLGPSYHVSDMNLFYMDIRENATLRVNAFLSKK